MKTPGPTTGDGRPPDGTGRPAKPALLERPRVLAGIAIAVFACVLLLQLPWSPAASSRFVEFTGTPPFDERPAGYTLSGVLLALHRLGDDGLRDYEAYRAVNIVFPWLLCALVAAVMLRIDAARAMMWPWLAAAASTAEGAAQWAMLLTRADMPPELAQWASLFTQVKFVLYAIMLTMLIAVGARYVWRQRRLHR